MPKFRIFFVGERDLPGERRIAAYKGCELSTALKLFRLEYGVFAKIERIDVCEGQVERPLVLADIDLNPREE